MEAWTFDSRDPDETRAAGRELGRAIGTGGLAIALIGPLGAGKTVFVKGLAEGLGVDPRAVSSPTFVIAQQYRVPAGPSVLHHVDLYRLEREEELESIGFYDMFEPGAVLAAEWADRFPGALGREFLSIELEGPSSAREGDADPDADPDSDPDSTTDAGISEASTPPLRHARVRAHGEAPRLVLLDWAERMGRLRSQRPGSFVEKRLAAPLVVALGLWLSAHAGVDAGVDAGFDAVFDGSRRADAVPPGCETLRATRDDALGTSHVVCAPDAGRGTRADLSSTDSAGLEGLARVLAGERIDLNRASQRLLETLPGLGPTRARAIVAARSERPFERLSDLERVHGIGPKTARRLARWLVVEGPTTQPGADATRGAARGERTGGRERG